MCLIFDLAITLLEIYYKEIIREKYKEEEYCSIIYNNEKLEITQIYINRDLLNNLWYNHTM